MHSVWCTGDRKGKGNCDQTVAAFDQACPRSLHWRQLQRQMWTILTIYTKRNKNPHRKVGFVQNKVFLVQ
jgi:hypothetical protein